MIAALLDFIFSVWYSLTAFPDGINAFSLCNFNGLKEIDEEEPLFWSVNSPDAIFDAAALG